MLKSPVCRTLALFFVLIIVSMIWTTANSHDEWEAVKTYRKLLFFFALFGLGMTLAEYKQKLLGALFLGSFCSALCCICVYIGVPGFPEMDPYQGAIFMKNHITQGFILGLLLLTGVYVFFKAEAVALKSMGIVAAFLAVYVSFYLINGRTGFLSVGVAILSLVLFLPNSLKQRAFALLIVAACSITVLLTSDRFQDRFLQGTQEIQQYANVQQPHRQTTSMGLRMLYLERGINIVSKAPLFGHGVGSWPNQFDQDQFDEGIQKDDDLYQGSGNPHNDYILIATQVGLVGLLLWFAFLGPVFNQARRMPRIDFFLLSGVLGMYCAGSFFNSFTYDVTEGTLLFLISGIVTGTTFKYTTTDSNS